MTRSFYENYWSGGTGHLSDFTLKWPKLKKYTPLEKGAVVLDFGCGKGEILKEMEKVNPNAQYIGLDVSQTALDSARRELPEVEFHKVEDGGPFPLPDASVDFVFSSEVIEHVYDTDDAASEIARILRPGGKLLMTTPYHGFFKNLAIVLFGFDRHFDPVGPHVRFFSKRTLANLLEKNGLKIAEHGYYGRFYPFSHSIFVLAQKKISE